MPTDHFIDDMDNLTKDQIMALLQVHGATREQIELVDKLQAGQTVQLDLEDKDAN